MNNKKLTIMKIIDSVIQSLITATLGACVGLSLYEILSHTLPYTIKQYDFVFAIIATVLLGIQFLFRKKLTSLMKFDK